MENKEENKVETFPIGNHDVYNLGEMSDSSLSRFRCSKCGLFIDIDIRLIDNKGIDDIQSFFRKNICVEKTK